MKPKIFKSNSDELVSSILANSNLENVNIKGKNILLTGATAGIGQSLAIAGAKAGATMILLDKSIPALERTYDQIMSIGGCEEPFLLPVDLTGANLDDYLDIAKTLLENIDQLDGIIHNAALFDGLFSILQSNPSELMAQIQTNLTAPIWLTQAMFELLKKSDQPTILCANHAEATNDKRAYFNSYAISKVGLMKFVKQLAFEYENNYNLYSYGYDSNWLTTGLSISAYPSR